MSKLCTNIHLKSIAGIKGKQKSDKMQQISCVFNMVRDLVHSLEKLWKIHSQDVVKYGRIFELIKNDCCVVYNTGNLEITLSPWKKCWWQRHNDYPFEWHLRFCFTAVDKAYIVKSLFLQNLT